MEQVNVIYRSRNLYLLASLAIFFIVSPFLVANQLSNIFLTMMFLFIIIFCVMAVSTRKNMNILTTFLGALSVIGYLRISIYNADHQVYINHFIINAVFLSVVAYEVIESVARKKVISADALFGAIAGYLLIGFAWTYIYLVIAGIYPQAFSDHSLVEPFRQRTDDFVYFSFETLTTLGYGDILPLLPVARTFTWLEAAVGQIYLAVWISRLVGLYIVQHKSEE